jgi:hypothetical protein
VAQTYNSFREGIEGAPHGSVHWGVGGNEWGDFVQMTSPCDPLFWPLHAYLDKLWNQWQRSASTHFSNFGGPLSNGATASLNTLIPSYSFTVRDVLDITRGPFCYQYSDDTQLHDQTVNQLVNDIQKRDLANLDTDHILNMKLRGTPSALPLNFINRMNWNVTAIRSQETKYSQFITVCNSKITALKKAVDESIKAADGDGSYDNVVSKYQKELGSVGDLKKFAERVGKKYSNGRGKKLGHLAK